MNKTNNIQNYNANNINKTNNITTMKTCIYKTHTFHCDTKRLSWCPAWTVLIHGQGFSSIQGSSPSNDFY